MSTTNHRRERGYRWEKSIVDFFNDRKLFEDWHAKRLGGTSTELPDILITNNKLSILYSVEAKSTTGNLAYIHNDQICRCMDILGMFSIYRKRYVVFAFKFAKSKCNPRLVYYFFRVLPKFSLRDVKTIRCDNTGKINMIKMNGEYMVKLEFMRHDHIKFLRDLWSVQPMDFIL